MTKGYWIAGMDVHDPDNYAKEYVSRNAEPIKAFGGRFLVRGGTKTHFEGTERQRVVVIEFPSYQAALDCYNSPGYQDALSHRVKYGSGDFVIIEGYDGPQPGE